MNRKNVSIAVVSMAVVFLAVTCVTASSQTTNAPLYTIRIEQASSEMNFLPTAVNEFTYSAKDGYTLNWGFVTDDGALRSVFVLRDTWKYEYGAPVLALYHGSCDLGTCYGKTCTGTCPSDTCMITCPVYFGTGVDAWLCNTALDNLLCCDYT